MLAWLELRARKGSAAPLGNGQGCAPAAEGAVGALLGKQPRPLPAYLAHQLAQRTKAKAEAAAGSAAGGRQAPDATFGVAGREPCCSSQQPAAPSLETTPASAPPLATGAAPLPPAPGLKQLVGRTLLLCRPPPQTVWHEATITRVAGSAVRLEFTCGSEAPQWVDLREVRYHLVPQQPPQPPAAWQDVVGRRALVHWPEDGCFYEGEFSAYQGDHRLPGDGHYIVSYAATAAEGALEEEILLRKVTHYFLGEESGSGGGAEAGGDGTTVKMADSPAAGEESGWDLPAAAGVKRTAAAAFWSQGSESDDEAVDIMR